MFGIKNSQAPVLCRPTINIITNILLKKSFDGFYNGFFALYQLKKQDQQFALSYYQLTYKNSLLPAV